MGGIDPSLFPDRRKMQIETGPSGIPGLPLLITDFVGWLLEQFFKKDPKKHKLVSSTPTHLLPGQAPRNKCPVITHVWVTYEHTEPHWRLFKNQREEFNI